jgi:hypothetical protein
MVTDAVTGNGERCSGLSENRTLRGLLLNQVKAATMQIEKNDWGKVKDEECQ